MKQGAWNALLSLTALVGVGLVYYRLDTLDAEVRLLTHSRSAASRTVVEAPPAYGEGSAREVADRAAPAGVEAGGAAAGRRAAADSASAPARSRSVEERLAQLEQESAARSARSGPAVSWAQPASRFVRSVDDLAEALKLSNTQKDRVNACVERGRRRIEDLLKLPDAEGRSPWERREEQRRKLEEALKAGKPDDLPGAVLHAGLGGGRGYRNNRIPGRNATYGEEIDRIKKETRSEIEADLDQPQREAFQKTHTDALLGEGGGMALSVFTSAGGDGAAIAFEAIEEVAVEAPPPAGK